MSDRQNIYAGGSQPSNQWLQKVMQTPFDNAYPVGATLTVNDQTRIPFSSIFVERVESPCIISVGPERQYKLGRFEPGDQVSFALPSAVDIIYIDYTNLYALQFTAAGGVPLTDETDANTPAVTVWLANEIIYYARNNRYGRIKSEYTVSPPLGFTQQNPDDDIINPDDNVPVMLTLPQYMNTADIGFRPMGNASSFSPFAHNIGAQSLYSFPDPEGLVSESNASGGIPRPQRGIQRMFLDTYTGMIRSAVRPRWLSLAVAANTRVPLAVLSCNDNNIRVRLRRVEFWLVSVSAAMNITIDLLRTIGQPTGGAALSSVNHEGGVGSACVLDRIPTGGVTEVNNSQYGIIPMNLGLTGAASVVNPAVAPERQILWDDTIEDGAMPPSLQGDNIAFNGFGIYVDSTAAGTVNFMGRMIWTEHNIFV